MASKKRFYAGVENGRVRFRATATFTFKSLTFYKSGEWMGFSSAASAVYPAREISKPTYNTLLALKEKRVNDTIAARVAAGEEKTYWSYENTAKPVLMRRPITAEDFRIAGFGSTPAESWVSLDDVPTELLEEVSGIRPLDSASTLAFASGKAA